MKPLIEPGRCSACKQTAERGRSGAWWHAGGEACGQASASFEPGRAEERQQQAPRNRQIPHPPEDR